MTKPFIVKLIKEMTVDEKLAQLSQLVPMYFGIDNSIDLTGPFNQLNLNPDAINDIGSVLNNAGAQRTIDLQNQNLKNNRHKIPLLFMADVIHGFKTIFPIPIAMGCTFDTQACEESAMISAREGAAAGIQVTFSPMADLVRDPRWGRVMESPGEDPYLNVLITASMVKGYQGSDLKEKGRMAACVKHFAGYGAAEGGREYNTVDLSAGLLREYYLPAYKAAIDAGVALVMSSFNTIDRVPATVNDKLLRGILRDEWSFNGVVISDFNSVDEVVSHGAATDSADVALKSLTAGVDIEMMSTHYLNSGKSLVEQGKLDISIIDEAVIRVLELKDALGLFENPYKDASPEMEEQLFLCDEHRKSAREIAQKSAVLLKNNSVLPLKKNCKIGLAGPFALSHHVLGGWVVGEENPAVSLYEGIAQKISAKNIVTAMTDELGSMQNGIFDVEDHIEEACERLKECDIIIAAVGESSHDTGEGSSKTNIRLSENQENLILSLKKTGKPVIVIVFSGRPMEIKPICDSSDAIIQAWFLGTESGNALADILYGDYNPSGRLSMSFPYTVGQIPVYYNSFNTGRPFDPNKKGERYVSRYLDCPNDPLFCFGYGLSYSNFVYSDFQIIEGKTATASITVENNSEYAGKETVQLYIHDVSASVVRPLKELKGFRQILLNPHERKTVAFEITEEMLMFYDNSGNLIFENGEFDVMIGKNSSEVFSKRIRR